MRRTREELAVFGELVERYRTAIQRLCYRRVGDWQHAEDLAQETFVLAYRKLAQLGDAELFGHWLRTIAVNVCRAFLRETARREVALETLEHAAVAPPPELPGLPLADLPPGTARCLELFYGEGYSYAEIAGQLHTTVASVKGRIRRGKMLLRKEMAAMMPTPKSAFTQRVMATLGQLASQQPEERARAVGDVRRSLDTDHYARTLATLRGEFSEEDSRLTEWEKSELVRLAINAAKRFRQPRGMRRAARYRAPARPGGDPREGGRALVAQRDPAVVAALRAELDNPRTTREERAVLKSTITYLEHLAPPPTPDLEPYLLRRDLQEAVNNKVARRELLKRLTAALEDPSPRVRDQAIKALEHLGDKRAVPALIQRLDDLTTGVRRAAATALGTLASPRAVAALLRKMTESANLRHDMALVYALGEIGDPQALPAVLLALEQGDWGVTCLIANNGTVAKLATRESLPRIKETVNRLTQRTAADYGIRSARVAPDAAMPQDTITAIYHRALARVADARELPELLCAFAAEPANQQLADALRRIADPRALEAMRRQLAQGNRLAAAVLSALGSAGLQELKEGLRSSERGVREAAAHACFFAGGAELIAQQADEEAISLLEELAAHDPSSSARLYAKAAARRARKVERRRR